VVKCAPSAGQDPLEIRLLFAAIPSILALGIAALVFYWNGGREHRRWVLDQRKAEWKELLIKVAAIEEIIPFITSGLPNYKLLEPAVLAILPLLRGNIFIHHTLESSGFIERWKSFGQYVSGEFEARIREDNDLRRGLLDFNLTSEVLTSSAQIRQNAESEVRTRLHGLRDELHTLAQKELKI
jgi:hypothetical protein